MRLSAPPACVDLVVWALSAFTRNYSHTHTSSQSSVECETQRERKGGAERSINSRQSLQGSAVNDRCHVQRTWLCFFKSLLNHTSRPLVRHHTLIPCSEKVQFCMEATDACSWGQPGEYRPVYSLLKAPPELHGDEHVQSAPRKRSYKSLQKFTQHIRNMNICSCCLNYRSETDWILKLRTGGLTDLTVSINIFQQNMWSVVNGADVDWCYIPEMMYYY